MRWLLLLWVALAGCSLSPATPCSPAAPCRDGECRGGFCVFSDDAGEVPDGGPGDAGPPGCRATCKPTEGSTCVGEVCTWGLTDIEFKAPDAGALVSQTVLVKLLLRKVAAMAELPASVQLAVGPPDAGIAPITVPFNTLSGDYPYTLALPFAGRFELTASSGPSAATLFIDNDPLAPVVFVEVLPAAPRSVDAGWTDDDPACPGCYKRDERARLLVRTGELGLDPRGLGVSVYGLRRDGGGFSASTVGVFDAGLVAPDGGLLCQCPGWLCRCFEVDLGLHPFEAGRGQLTVEGYARDLAGNVGTATAAVDVTRLRWQQRVPLAPGESLYPPVASPALGALVVVSDGVGGDGGSLLMRLDQGGGIVAQRSTTARAVLPPVVTEGVVRRVVLAQFSGGTTTLETYLVGNLLAAPTRFCGPLAGEPIGNLAITVNPDAGTFFDGGPGAPVDVAVFVVANNDAGTVYRAQVSVPCVASPVSIEVSAPPVVALAGQASAAYVGSAVGAGGVLQGAFLADAGVQPFTRSQPLSDCVPTALAVLPQGGGQVVAVCRGAAGSRLVQSNADLTGTPWLGPPALSAASGLSRLTVRADAGTFFGLFTAAAYPPLTAAAGPALFEQELGAVGSPASFTPLDAAHAPTVGRDGTLYVVSRAGELIAYEAGLGTVWSMRGLPLQPSSVLLDCKRNAVGGVLALRPGSAFVFGREPDAGVVSAFSVDSRGLDISSPWPMELGTSRNTSAPIDDAAALAFTCP